MICSAQWSPQVSHSSASLRGISAVSPLVTWASGSNGTVLLTTNGGSTWRTRPVTGAETLDFRDIQGFDSESAYVMSVGSGPLSRIYKTADAGGHWTLLLRNQDEKGFFDAVAFWDAKRGIVMGDQVGGRIYVAFTSDGGATWRQVDASNMPPAHVGEGGFAASGTSAITGSPGRAWLATGGVGGGRVFRTADWGRSWQVADTPVRHDTAASGIFSIAFQDALHGVIVGGDYSRPEEARANAATTSDGGNTWTTPVGSQPGGYRSAVAFLPGTNHAVALGTSGGDYSVDGGHSWSPLSPGNYNALSFASPSAGWAVGPKGAIAKWTGPR